MLIAGDIGGTKTQLAIFSNEGGPQTPLAQVKVPSAGYDSLEAIVKEFLAQANQLVDRACFAVAGPVIGGRVKTTNLPWVIETDSLARTLGLDPKRVRLFNDLEAIAEAVPLLGAGDVEVINRGEAVDKGAIGVVAPGTGLGESFLTWNGSRYVTHSSEGGHCDFAPTDERQIRLLQYLLQKLDHVSVERVCSGIGIPNIYDYLREVERMNEEPEIASLIAAAGDRSAVIIEHSAGPAASRLCTETIEMFVSIVASETANLALKVLATGGVYLAGGVVVHTLHALHGPGFMESFRRKGRFAGLVTNMPVHVIVTAAALMGAAARGLEPW